MGATPWAVHAEALRVGAVDSAMKNLEYGYLELNQGHQPCDDCALPTELYPHVFHCSLFKEH